MARTTSFKNLMKKVNSHVDNIVKSNKTINDEAIAEQQRQTKISSRQFGRNAKQGMEGILDPQIMSTSSLASKREKGTELADKDGIKFATNQKIAYVPSTAVQKVRRNPITNRTYITYKNGTGKEYEFQQSDYQFDELMNADSKGQHVNKMRKDPTQNLKLM